MAEERLDREHRVFLSIVLDTHVSNATRASRHSSKYCLQLVFHVSNECIQGQGGFWWGLEYMYLDIYIINQMLDQHPSLNTLLQRQSDSS